MTSYTLGTASSDAAVIRSNGGKFFEAAAGAQLTIYDAPTGGNLLGTVTTDVDGQYALTLPDGKPGVGWVDTGDGGPRVRVYDPQWVADLASQAQTSAASVNPGVPNGVATLDASSKLVQHVGAGNVDNIPLNLRSYGAKGDGVTDDSAAVAAWVDAVLAAEGVGYAPPGDYLLNSAVVRNGIDSKHFALTGAGVGVTRFIVPSSNTTGAFLFSSTTARDGQLTARDFTIVPQGVGNGTGLAFTMPAGGNQHQRSAILTDIEVKADDITAPVFSIGINLAGTWRPSLRNVVVGGPWDSTVASNYADTSPQYVGTAALVLDDAYDWTVDSCHLWAYYTLLRDLGTTSEAGRLINTICANGRVGFDRKRNDPEPIVWVDNCHFNNRDINIRIDGAKLAVIRGCHPYNQDTGNLYTGTATDILLKNTDRTVIANCVFHYDGAPDRINIDVDTTTLGDNILIEGCTFSALAARAIRIGTAATVALIIGNIYPGTITQRVEDDSGNAIILDRNSGGGLLLENQNAGSASGPDLVMRRDSASPAANDQLGTVQMWGRNSAASWIEYVLLRTALNDPTAGSEDGELDIYAMIAGALTKIAAFTATSNVGNTGMFLLCQTATGTTLRRVSLGPADSAGTGYSYLRVPN